MKYSHPLLLAAALWLVPMTLFAQDKQQQQPPVPVKTTPLIASSENDILVTEDVIELQVGNHSDLDQSAIVDRDGKITLRELGQFVAVGKTRAVLQNEIQVAADKTLNNAPVYVTIKDRHVDRISIDGGVSAPGVYPLQPGMRVLDAISAARGLPLKPIRYTAKLVRKDQSQSLNVPLIYSDPASSANVVLMPNDKVVFNEIDVARHRVTVLGQVQRPSTYDTEPDINVLNLLGQAGGYSPAAALSKVTVTRGPTVIALNLRPTLITGTVDPAILDFRFQDGDVVSVPGVETKYQVLGAVNRPSSFVFPEQAKITILDALNTAGGTAPRANLKKAFIHRTENGKVKNIPVDFEAINKKGIASANVLLEPDDILVIPALGPRGITLNDVIAPIGLLNILGFRLFN